MYIRRKAYSVVIDKNGEEKLFSTTEIMSEESYLEKLYSESEPEQKEFNSKAQKARVAKWRKGQTGNDVKPARVYRHDKNFKEIEVSKEGNIERNRREILKNKNLDPLAIKEEQSRTINYNNKGDGPQKATFKHRKLDKIIESEKNNGWKDVEIELDSIYKKKVNDLKAKKRLKKNLKTGGKIAAGTILAGASIYGAKKLYDKEKQK